MFKKFPPSPLTTLLLLSASSKCCANSTHVTERGPFHLRIDKGQTKKFNRAAWAPDRTVMDFTVKADPFDDEYELCLATSRNQRSCTGETRATKRRTFQNLPPRTTTTYSLWCRNEALLKPKRECNWNIKTKTTIRCQQVGNAPDDCMCREGNFFDSASGNCSPCNAGTYQDATTHTFDSCKDCPPGFLCENDETSEPIDINECEDPDTYSCPANSDCSNVDGGYNCVCHHGFAVEGFSPNKIGNPSSVCAAMGIEASVVPTSTSATYTSISKEENLQYFNVVLNLVDKFNQVFAIEKFNQVGATVDLLSLQPGTKYELHVTGVNDQGTEVGVGEGFGTQFTTTCNCNANPDPSGKPMNFRAYQNEGIVTFEFIDASMCETAYSFSRQAIGWANATTAKEIFTQDYFYFSKDPCGEVYRPGKRSADDLSDSQLTVGDTYRYCARAVGVDYTSDDACADHIVDWEASVAGLVRLKVEAGSLPVENVTVAYTLDTGDFEIVGSVVTGEDGKFYIPIKAVDADGNRPSPAMENNKPYELSLSYSKITSGENGDFSHKFLCEGGVVPCELSSSPVYLTHLDFDTPIEIIDDSTVPITGKVLIDNTFCGIHNAEVCIVDHLARSTGEAQNCVETEPDGSFEIGAVIGTRVTLEVNYFDHTFELSHELTENGDNTEGFVIDATKVYEGFIFRDIQENTLKVDVFGGECRRFLGPSKVTYSVKGCSDLDPDGSFGDLEVDLEKGTFTIDHKAVYSEYFVPAHDLEVVATVYDNLDLPLQRIDMRELPSNETAAAEDFARPTDHSDMVNGQVEGEEKEILEKEEAKDDEIADPNLLKFKFDGKVDLDINLSANPGNKCMQDEFLVDSPRFKLPAYRMTNVTVLVAETFPDRKDGSLVEACDVFDDDLQVFIRNQLGFMGTDDDKNFLEQESLTDVDRALLTGCSEGCFFDIEYDREPITGEKSRAHVNKKVMVGTPFFDANEDTQDDGSYLRLLTAEVTRNGALTSLTAEALVVGDLDQGFIDKIGLPTHEPLMVLRDPPGGLSSASYENVESTVFVKMDSFERKVKAGLWFDASTDVNTEHEMCLGGGLGAIMLACDGLGAKGLGTLKTDTHGDFTVDHDVDKSTASFKTTWSYTTSSDPLVAGQASDIFVVPTLNINFYIVHEVEDDDDNCVGQFRETVKFDVGANENQAVSFYTHRDILDFEIPDYRDRLEQLQEQTSDVQCNETRISEERFACEAVEQTARAVESWERFLDEYETTNQAALDGTYGNEVQKINEWFDYTVESTNRGNLDGSDIFEVAGATDHYSGLMPKSLQEDAQVVKEGPVDGAAEDLETTQFISFSGGGSKFSFSLGEDKEKSVEGLTGKAFENSQVSFDLSTSFMMKTSFIALSARFDVGPDFHTDATRVTYQTDIRSQGSKVGFNLGDGNVGDKFDIKVSLDKRYGTFVFSTMPSSRSMCPHEAGTVKRVDPFLRIVEFPPPLVLPDEPMLFKLELTNLGEDRGNFQIFSDRRANEDDLRHQFAQFSKDIDFIDGGETMVLTVPVERGPVEYRYPPAPITMRSPCEFVGGDGNMFGVPDDERTQFTVELYNNREEKLIEFAEPCPDVTLVKPCTVEPFVVTAEEEDSHLINVVVRNPSASVLGKFSDQQENVGSRLEHVQLKYLDKARHKVSVATVLIATDGDEEPFDVDFAAEMGNEDQVGFASIQWDVEVDSLADGEYEFWTETVCEEFPGANPSFNGVQSDRVQMVVDRKRPKLFGLPKPPTGAIFPGSKVIFEFSEDVDCHNRFELVVDVEGIDRIFDNKFDGSDNLLVACEGRSIEFQFDITNTRLDGLLGKPFHMELTGVADLAGNKLVNDRVEHDLQFSEGDVQQVGVNFEVRLDQECNANNVHEESLVEEIAEFLELNPTEIDRMHVTSMACVSNGSQIIAAVMVEPPKLSGRRLGSVGGDQRSPADIFYGAVVRHHGGRTLEDSGTGITASNLKVILPGVMEADAENVVPMPNQDVDLRLDLEEALSDLQTSPTSAEAMRELEGVIIVATVMLLIGILLHGVFSVFFFKGKRTNRDNNKKFDVAVRGLEGDVEC